MEGLCGHSGALAALRLLQNYNHLLMPPDLGAGVLGAGAGARGSLLGGLAVLPPTYLPQYCHQPHAAGAAAPPSCPSPSPGSGGESRRRGEKRPIPAEQKDEKYFERRKRNNQAAKKSRDARKIREDQIAWRACVLEHENASLRAHVAALKQEALTLRKLLLSADERLRALHPPPQHPHHAHHAQPASSTTVD